jgi:hypothetical protein
MAITGFPIVHNLSATLFDLRPCSLASGDDKGNISLISAPAINARFPEPVMMTTRISSSPSAFSRQASNAMLTSLFSAFNASGRLMVRTAIFYFFS